MLVKLHIELIKLLRKSRTYIGPIAMTCLVVLMLIAMKYGHETRHMQERLSEEFIISGSLVNAVFLARFMLLEFVVYMFLPLFSCMVFGDLLASEAADGTLRTLLCRPVTRIGVFISKFLTGVMYVTALVFGTGLIAYILGAIFLGRGSLFNFTNGIWVLPEKTAILRLLLAYGLITVGMIAVGSISFAISTFLSNSNGAIAGAMGIVIFSSIIGQIEYFSSLRPYLLTTYLQVGGFFTDKVDVQLLTKSLGVMLAYSVVSLVIGMIIFHRRDVLS